jgi:DNA-binding XRE family transcriptional regulator
MPFGHQSLTQSKPKNISYLWKSDHYPTTLDISANTFKKRRFDLKMPAYECQKLLGVDKSTLTKWEQGKHKPSREHCVRIARFLGYHRRPFCRSKQHYPIPC